MTWRELFLTPRGFLMLGGAILLIIGILGFLNVFTSQGFYLTTGENVAHLLIGAIALGAVFLPGVKSAVRPYYRSLSIAIGLIALFFAIYGMLLPAGNPPTELNLLGVANLELWDSVINFIVFIWAFAAAFSAPPQAQSAV